MKKNNKVLKGFLVAGITAFTMPPIVVYGQTGAGEDASSTYSGSSHMKGGTSSDMSGSTGTHSGSSGTSGMPGSTGIPNDSSLRSAMNKDMATTEADKRLNSQIRQSLSSDTSLPNVGQNIHFSTQNGRVTLHGSVASETQKNQLEEKVTQLNDVKSVQNELEVSSEGSSS